MALPGAHSHVAPAFDHYGELPMVTVGASRAIVLTGELVGVRSPANTYSRMVGAEIAADRDGRTVVPLDLSFEHAIMPIDAALDLTTACWSQPRSTTWAPAGSRSRSQFNVLRLVSACYVQRPGS